MKFILGKKIGMTTVYDAAGLAKHITLVECVGNKVALIRQKERDGYDAIQLMFPKTKKRIFKREFPLTDKASLNQGDAVEISIFELGERVSVSGLNKAKGFQGGVKRHGFGGSPRSHGHKHDLRAPGAIGSGYPEHVVKGKRMAGRMGGVRSTSENLEISYIDLEKSILGVKGAVPGIPGTVVEIRTVK